MTKIQNLKHLVIEYWNLGFICNLVLVFWDFTSLRKTLDAFQQSLNTNTKIPHHPRISAKTVVIFLR
jgi:hypothetical protein